MKALHPAWLASAFMATAMGHGFARAQGATAPYNEAVRIVDGKRLVELPPPVPGYSKSRRPPPISAAFRAGVLIEHSSGLVQCTWAMYERESCEPSDYGRVKRMRTWIVKRDGHWQGCVGLPTPTRCAPLYPKLGPNDPPFGHGLPAEMF